MPAPPVSKPIRPWVVVLVGVSLLTSIAAVGARFVSLPYDSIGPGSARAVNSVVTVEGHPSYPPRGQLLYTTVAVRERVNPYEALAGWLDPDTDVIPEEKVRGDISTDDFKRMNVEAMADSKTTAQLLALRHLGFTDLGDGAEIVDVDPDLPAASLLRAHDVIVGVDDRTVAGSADAVAGIQAREPGDVLHLRLDRDGQIVEVDAPLGRSDDGGPLLGVRLSTRVKLPFDIEIDSGKVVGPSAGLAYALELLDVLTPGELTGGRVVAATGDLQADGTVGPIGGVAQKAVTVRRAGAEVFLVPRANLDEAKTRAGSGVQVLPVDSFDDALHVLSTLDGSNALALGPLDGGPPGGGGT
ncbi:MAG: Lon-like protease [Actinomycetota bacterium]|jgi:PDZ domain-containing protein|nr:Lon-like protease [Actinomycetota bacterium]